MKPFQPLTATEHLEQLYNAGHDWAGEVAETLRIAADVSAALGFNRDTGDFAIFALAEIEALAAKAATDEETIADLESQLAGRDKLRELADEAITWVESHPMQGELRLRFEALTPPA